MTKPKKKGKPVHRRQFVTTVRVGLFEEEREPLVKEATSARKNWLELKAEASNVAATYRAKLKELSDRLDEALLTLSQGRPTERKVVEERDFGKCRVKLTDAENGTVYMNRPMTDEDAQLTIPDRPNGEVEEEEQDENGGDPGLEDA